MQFEQEISIKVENKLGCPYGQVIVMANELGPAAIEAGWVRLRKKHRKILVNSILEYLNEKESGWYPDPDLIEFARSQAMTAAAQNPVAAGLSWKCITSAEARRMAASAEVSKDPRRAVLHHLETTSRLEYVRIHGMLDERSIRVLALYALVV